MKEALALNGTVDTINIILCLGYPLLCRIQIGHSTPVSLVGKLLQTSALISRSHDLGSHPRMPTKLFLSWGSQTAWNKRC